MEISDKYSSPKDEESCRHGHSTLKTLAAGVFSGCFLFVHLFAFELILNYAFSRKLSFPKIIYYLIVYLIIGASFGLGIGALRILTAAVAGRISKASPDRLFVSLAITGFVFFLGFIVLNAQYLPFASLTSPKSFLLNILLATLCFPLAVYLYSATKRFVSLTPMTLIMSIGLSVAAIMVTVHAFAFRAGVKGEIGLLKTAGIMSLFIICGAVFAAFDLQAESVLAGRKAKGKVGVRLKHILAAKVVVSVLLLCAIAYARHYRPLVTPSEQRQTSTVAGERPNIIILVMDTVRRDRLSLYGCERNTSPNISRLAEKSLTFDAYSPASWTLPSHAAIVTGLYPTENGTGRERNYRIDPRNVTLAEILSENGYSTAAVIGNHLVLDQSSGFAQGFDYYYANPTETSPAFSFIASYVLAKFIPDAPVFDFFEIRNGKSINKIALQWLTRHKHSPFFLFINYMDAHAPYLPPDPYNRQWSSGVDPSNFFGQNGIWREFNYEVNAGKRKVLESEREYLLGQYDGEIAYLDSQIGALLEKLKKMGVFDNSLIVLTSDHGEMFSEHGLIQHPRVLYQQLIKVPLIVKLPAAKKEKPARMPGTVSLVDLYETILKCAGVPHESRPDSVDILETAVPAVFSETHSVSGESGPEFLERFGSDLYSVIEGNYKLIYAIGRTYQLFDIVEDPLENDDLLEKGMSKDDEVAFVRMKADLGSWVEDIDANRLETSALSKEADTDVRSRLKALGYIQ